MSAMTESKVGRIVKSLTILEDDLDSLNTKAADMKKQLSLKAQNEVDSLFDAVRQMATKEAQAMIDASKAKADMESTKISQKGEVKLTEIQSKIDGNFDDAVEYVVSTILKP